MQLTDLVQPIDKMSDDELLERLRQVRHSREVVRPAAKARVARVEKKVSRTRVKKSEDLLSGLSEAERNELIRQLTEG